MAEPWLRLEETALSVCGTWRLASSYAGWRGTRARSGHCVSPQWQDPRLDLGSTQRCLAIVGGEHRQEPVESQFCGHISGFASVAFSADGKRLAAGCYDLRVRLWDIRSGKELRRFRFPGRIPYRVFFSADGITLTATSFGQIISTWSAASGIERLSVRSTKGFCFGAAVSADRRSLAGADTEHVCVWEMATGKERVRIPHGEKERIGALAYSPDGKLLIGALFSQGAERVGSAEWAGGRPGAGAVEPGDRTCFLPGRQDTGLRRW